MKLLTSEQTRTFGEIDELREFNNLQEQNYSWIQIPTFSGEYIPLEDNPICIPVIRDTLGISEDVSNDTIAEQMQDTKLALSYPNESNKSCYPVGPTAYKGIFERVGATCTALTSLKDTRKMDEVSPSDKAAICNLLTKYSKGDSLLLVGDELILADLSSDYVNLPFSDILDITEDILYNNFEKTKYVRGRVCHASSLVEFMFQDDETDSNLFDAFSSIGIDTTDYNAHIVVLTSNVGLSGANIYPFIRNCKNGKIISVGSPIKLEHIGSANLDKFRENLQSCFASFRDVSDHINAMKDIVINNPADCLYNIGHKIALPEKALKETCEEFDNEYPFSCSGSIIYLKLFEVLDNYISDEEEKVSDIRQMQIQENITRICFYQLSKFDIPVIG